MTKGSDKKTATYKFSDPNPGGILEKALAPIVAKAIIREYESKGKEDKAKEDKGKESKGKESKGKENKIPSPAGH